ncbi:hypothetical protein ACFV9D_06035 [Streptomyces sp. NPDC059875]|uniref:hypothetical protein n=1 Tax=unclassified Streptomyces TaxID=2593676 RepID=UPI00364ADEA7
MQAVPAVYLEGRDAIRVTERRDGQDRTVTSRVTTALSDALAPAPKPPTYAMGCLGVLAVLVSVATFVAGTQAGHWFPEEDQAPDFALYGVPEPEPSLTFLGVISALALLAAVLAFVQLARRRTAFRRVMRGRPTAEDLWSRAWYCSRCGTVHFGAGFGEDSRPLTFQQFRERVWEAGGYGALAAEQRAVEP